MKSLPRLSSITPNEIRMASEHTNFGGRDPAEVVLEGLCSVACGFRPGYTVQCILMDLKLIGWRGGKTITKKGKMVLNDLLRGRPLAPLLEDGATATAITTTQPADKAGETVK